MGQVCPVVLVPGLDGTGTLFEPILAALGPEFEPHIVRYRQGLQPFETHVADVVEVIERVGRPLLLVGESFGGPVTVATAARCPEQVRALCLVATFVIRPHWTTRHIVPLFRALTSIPVPDAVLGVILNKLLGEPGADRKMLQQVVRANNHRRSAVLAHRTAITSRVDQRDNLKALEIPVGYIGGTADRIVPAGEHAERIRALRPDTTVEMLAGAPHMLLQLRPQQCAELIRTLAVQAGLLEAS